MHTRMNVEGAVLWVNLLMRVDVAEWNEVSQSERKLNNFLTKKGISKKVALIEEAITDMRRHHRLTKRNLESAIESIVLADKRDELKRAEELKKYVEDKKRSNVKNFVTEYIKGIENGEVRTSKKEKYAKESVKNWLQFKRVFLDFYKIRPFGKTLIGVAERLGLHTNHLACGFLKSPQIKEEDKAKEIYLTKEELLALYDMPLTGFEEKVRDVFLIGCFTALRYSDYSRIEKANIGFTHKGTKVIRLRQEKTAGTVVIPILDERLETLLMKYDYNVPKISDQNLNRTIKEICRRLSETVPSLQKKERTVLTLKEKRAEEDAKKKKETLYEYDEQGYPLKARWELVASHTARRSCITNMYLSQRFSAQQMMSVSGHKTEALLYKYVKLSLDEYAECVASAAGDDGLF